MAKQADEKVARYDVSNVKKSGIGVFVVLANGQKYLFGETARWRWRTLKGQFALEVEEGGEVAFHAFAGHVACVGGPQTLYRDAEWK